MDNQIETLAQQTRDLTRDSLQVKEGKTELKQAKF
jgi:hypothetical protein